MAIRLVAIDCTGAWSDEVVKTLGECFELALYDDSEATYCCEMTPSRLLHPLCHEFERGFQDGSEELKALGVSSMTDLEWCDLGEPYYMHVGKVDSLPHLTWPDDPDETAEEQMEAARDYWTGNTPGVAEILAGGR